MKRATISMHTEANDSHLDIFLEDNENLLTFNANYNYWTNMKNGESVEIIPKFPHRKIYLDYEGEISENRGFLKILWKGNYSLKTINQNKWLASLQKNILFISGGENHEV